MIGVLYRVCRRVQTALIHNYGKILCFFLALLIYSATGYMYFELPDNPDLNWADAFWWAMVTMTTVGYGDLFPSSPGGRFLVAFPTMLFGIGILGYGLSLVASFLIENKMKEVKGMKSFVRSGHIIIYHFANLDKTMNLIQEL
ncbi:MAG: potassium channel family protein, partial [Verrucomicrobiota bacterium]